MTRSLRFLSLLLFCLLLDGSLSNVFGAAAKAYNLLPAHFLDDHPSTVLPTEADVDADVYEIFSSISSSSVSAVAPKHAITHHLPAIVIDSHDLIYALHNLRI
jgi:hypothetical protein